MGRRRTIKVQRCQGPVAVAAAAAREHPRSRPGAGSPACSQFSSATGNDRRDAPQMRVQWGGPAHFLPHAHSMAAACDRACFRPLAATGTSPSHGPSGRCLVFNSARVVEHSGRGFVLAVRAASTGQPTGADWHRRPGPPGHALRSHCQRRQQQQLALQGGARQSRQAPMAMPASEGEVQHWEACHGQT